MTPKEVYIPVPYNENLKSDDLYVAFKPFKTPRVDFWLEKKELFVLTKEELKDFAEQARRYTLNNAQHVGSAVYVMGSTDDFFDDWINTQK